MTPTSRVRSFPRRATRWALPWLATMAVSYVLTVAGLVAGESRLIFPGHTFGSVWRKPTDPRTQDVWLRSADGTRLHGWWLPPARTDAGAFLIAHGNNGNVSRRGQAAAELNQRTGAGVLLFDYPGYGHSEGTPTEAGCYAAGDAAYAWVTSEARVPPGRVVLMGESLGTGVVVDLATRHEHRALVLLCPFTSLPAAAEDMLHIVPARWLMRAQFDSVGKIGRCPRPILVAHGTADHVVPFRQGEALFAVAPGPKEFVSLDGLRHNILGEHLYGPLTAFLDRHPPRE